jgi:hypothetical protein
MKTASTLALIFIALTMQTASQTPAELGGYWDREHVSNILPSNVRHKDLLNYLDGLKKLGVKVEEVGRSYANREIYQMEWGRGPTKIFLWSQMHGDEPTATSALIDMFTFLQKNRELPWVRRIEEQMTIRAVPMLNPDGTELFIRRSLQGIDINRDAKDLVTPEAQLLKRLRDEWEPHIGFNLHNQNALTAAGPFNRQAAISFLVVYGDAAKTESEGHIRNKRLVAVMTEALYQFIPGHVGRYDDDWTPTAFGDSFSAWGTPTILIETGGLHTQDEMYLVKMNFIAMMTAFRSLADGSEKIYSPANYDLIPRNTGGRLMNVVFRGASIVERSTPAAITRGDIGINYVRRRESFMTPTTIRRVGTFSAAGLIEYDVSGFFVTGRMQPVREGNYGELLFYKKDRAIDWAAEDLENAFPPDAIYSLGQWVKGGELFETKKP